MLSRTQDGGGPVARLRAVSKSLWRSAASFDRLQWLTVGAWFTILGGFGATVVAIRYLPYVEVSTRLGVVYLLLAVISHFGLVACVGLLICIVFPSVLMAPRMAFLIPLWSVALSILLSLLVIDAGVYAQYRFHLNLMIWDMLAAAGAGEVIQLSWMSYGVLFAVFLAMVLLALSTFAISVWIGSRPGASSWARWIGVGWLACFVVGQSIHAWYEARYDAEITGVTRHLPGYRPITAKRWLLNRGLLFPQDSRAMVGQLPRSSHGLAYPKNPMECATPEAPLDVLLIVVDAWRSDTFDAITSPNLFRLMDRPDAIWFRDHHSGGNVTKGGIFSLFFGIPATYWDAFAAAQTGPVWLSQHQQAGYEFSILSSSTLVSPPLDRTVFGALPYVRLGTPATTVVGRDEYVIRDMAKKLAGRDANRPHFGFLFLDSVHAYAFPSDSQTPFEPYWERVDHVMLDDDFDPLPYFNRYKNAVHYVDKLVGDFLQDLEDQHVLDHTVVILTSDHGEEFNDLGQNYWGHGSNFTSHQTRVPLLMLWPGRGRAVVDRKTSHYDLAPTLLQELLYCSNPASDYSSGENLFGPDRSRPWQLVYSYYNYAIVEPNRITVTYPTGYYEMRDDQYRVLKRQPLERALALDVVSELSRFYD